MCSIKDFFNFCVKRNINIYNALALNNEKKNWTESNSKITKKNLEYKNFFSELGIFLIEK
jgi:hypothetical protein